MVDARCMLLCLSKETLTSSQFLIFSIHYQFILSLPDPPHQNGYQTLSHTWSFKMTDYRGTMREWHIGHTDGWYGVSLMLCHWQYHGCRYYSHEKVCYWFFWLIPCNVTTLIINKQIIWNNLRKIKLRDFDIWQDTVMVPHWAKLTQHQFQLQLLVAGRRISLVEHQ